MNCEEANEIDLINYLGSLGHQPAQIRGNDYWFLSPLREENEASFKVNKTKNVWYDFGIGKGGSVIDFTTAYYRCNVSEALQKLFSFHQQKPLISITARPPVHLHKSPVNNVVAEEPAIKIIAAKKPITDLLLCSYLRKRKINKNIADKYCYEVTFKVNEKEKLFTAIGFKNNAGGYELRNGYFKGSSSPKYVSYFDNKVSENIKVFEGFFDFLSYQSLYQNHNKEASNYLVLNSLSFFERSLLLMEIHQSVHLYLDHDKTGIKCTEMALKRSPKFKDESKLYQGCKDLNEWLTGSLKIQKVKEVKHRNGRHL